MQEDGAAAASDARLSVVVDLNDEVVQIVIARQTVTGSIAVQPD